MNFNDFYGTKVTKANKMKRRAFVIAILVIISIIMNPAIIIMVRGQTGLKIGGGLTSGFNLNSGNLYSANRVMGSSGSNGNDFPIVFIHGAGGWGEDELLGFNYWGGFHSIPDLLRSLGFKVYVLQVGPVSSSWDRAVEAFYEIKGGRVNYGAAHSAKFGHNQYGREFSGFYPEWGTLNPDGTIKKIHIIAHSMGGQTARVLNTLLSNIYP
ncbi:MAG: esterase/lipase family protein, partial [Promethearchaeota archaeon]